MNETSMNMTPEGGKGSLIGSIIVVLILVIGAIYLYMTRSTPAPVEPTPTEETTPAPEPAQADDLQTLQSDANSVNTASIDASVSALNGDFQ